MYRAAALFAALALAVTPLAFASDEGNSNPATPATGSCTPLKAVYSEKHWRERQPARGVDVCPVADKSGARNTIAHWKLYRHYRQITPYRCLRGREGTFAIPCYIISCESHFNWWARNPSGALWIYQLLGWGAPAPSTFRARVRNHEIAHSLSLSNWVCA